MLTRRNGNSPKAKWDVPFHQLSPVEKVLYDGSLPPLAET